ncbi:hypothetical protein BC937DRAFT_91676 [Endogone sp. FLAS-F59071]|nr:hypothetical protein BC937DRAFT_91676 [Endogone sp. FLAS-F59071]|eukprot:RUS16034.1 hypothetical protein BC937DRAFT_91676 [Endogone sp. FLAS-F59071]
MSFDSESSAAKVLTSGNLVYLIFGNFVKFNRKVTKSIHQRTPHRYDFPCRRFHADFAESIYPPTFARFATVSKQFHATATRFLYRHIMLYPSNYSGDSTTRKLRKLHRTLIFNPIYCQMTESFSFPGPEPFLTGDGRQVFLSIIHLLPKLKNLVLPTETKLTEVISILRNCPCLKYLEYHRNYSEASSDRIDVANLFGADNFGLSGLYIFNRCNDHASGNPFFDKHMLTLLERLPRLTMLTLVDVGKKTLGTLSEHALQNIARVETLRIGESSLDCMNSMVNVAALRCTNLKRLFLTNALDLSDLTLLALAEHQKDSLTEIDMTNVRTIGPLGFRKLITSSTNLVTLIVVNNSLDLSLLVGLSRAGFRNQNLRTLELGHKERPITHQTFAATIDIFPRVTSLTVVIVEIAGHVAVPAATATLPLEMLDVWVEKEEELQMESITTPKDIWLVEDVGELLLGLKEMTLGSVKMKRCNEGWMTVVESKAEKSELSIPIIWMYRLQEESEKKAMVRTREDV